jgi:hypothetical protein
MSEHTSGRELDAMVSGAMGIDAYYCHDSDEWYEIDSRHNCTDELVPAYSTNIAAAWEVVEWMCERGSMTVLYIEATGSLVRVGGSVVDGASAPHAICLAALKLAGATE